MSRRSKLIIILLLVLTAAVIVFALFFMGRGGETSSVALPSPGQSSAVETGFPSAERITLTEENVQAVLAELNRAESYSCTVTVDDYWSDGSSTSQLQVWVNAGRTRIRLASGGGTKNILLDNGMLYIWYDSVSGVYSEPYEDSSDRWMRCITYEDVLLLPVEDILSAGYTQHAGENCISVEYTDVGVFGYTHRIYVSVNTGLLMGSETYDGDTLIYRMYSTIPDLNTPEENLFSPPDN